MKARAVLVAAAVLMALAAIAVWWLRTFERVEEDVPAPVQGEARYNPYFALGKVLRLRGIDVDARANLDLAQMAPAPRDTLILGSDVRTLAPAQIDALLEWVGGGGQLVFALPPGGEARAGDLSEALGLSVKAARRCLEWPVEGASEPARTCFASAFEPKREDVDDFDLLVGDDDGGYVLGRVAYGDGAWLAAADLDFLQNDRLDRAGMAAFAWQVLAPALQGGRVFIVYRVDVPPLYVLLVERGWPALVPALLALFAWLWSRSQRFGPVLPLAGAHRRALREHVQASGEFLFRRGEARALYAPVRRAFDERLRRLDPAIAALAGDDLVAALAARTGRTPAEIRLAVQPTDLDRAEHFLAAIRTLNEPGIRT